MPLILDPQGQPQAFDALAEPRPVGLDAVDQGRELTAGEARDAFERLFADFMQRRLNTQIVGNAGRLGKVRRHGS